MKLVLLVPDIAGPGARDIARAREWLDASGTAGLTLFEGDIGEAGRERHGASLPGETLEMVRRCDASFAPYSIDTSDLKEIMALNRPVFVPGEAGEAGLFARLKHCLADVAPRR